MSCNADTRHAELRKRIRTLTSLLLGFNVQKSPSKQPQDILPFLRHFTTLLTCGDKYDNTAKKVIAVTGSITSTNQVRTLVVAQNPHARSSSETISLELVKKDKRSFGEVVNGGPNALLVDHVADVWVALSAFDRRSADYQNQLVSLELFFLTRSYRKFVVRFKEDIRLCGGRRLYNVIADWDPDRSVIARKWVTPPAWLLKFQGLPRIKSRGAPGQVQWEFSDDTKRAWSKVLEIILRKVDDAIEQVKSAKAKSGKKGEEEARREISVLNTWCRTLYYFVVWDADIVKSLLTETNMVTRIMTTFMPVKGNNSVDEADDDDIAELRQETDESKGQQVLRYLKTVIAWHAAVHRLTKDATLPELLKDIEIGVVETPRSPTNVLTLPQVSEEFFKRFPEITDRREDVLKALTKHHSHKFVGCVHAEATLMGLVNYYGQSKDASHSALVNNAQNMQRIVQPVADAGNAVISVGKKCCWCCDWLGRNLETRFKLPGTHGIMYAWDPPAMGVSVSVLEKMEEELWGELYRAVSSAVELSYSRQSSAGSELEGMSGDEMFFSELKA